MMRVIAGKAKGHKLIAPAGIKTRPTGDRMKEDLFNILSSRIIGSRFLDLYCGSGAIGIEALSRKAEEAVFVDHSKEAIKVAKANLQKTSLTDRAKIFHMPVKEALNRLNTDFDIIFLDPPYKSSDIFDILPKLPAILAESGIVIIECPKNTAYRSAGLSLSRLKTYSQTQFLFFEKEERICLI